MLAERFRARGWSAPVVIGGTGGSGTRVVAHLVRSLGVALGANLNEAGDAIEFGWLYDKYVNPYLTNRKVEVDELETDLWRAITTHLDPAAHARWGWKNPRSIYLLPLFDELIPGLTFVHVIRNGLDMALSPNQNQLERHGRAALGAHADAFAPEVRSALLWQKVNTAAAAHGKRMPGRYFLMRYEDVCADPSATLAPLARALGLKEGISSPEINQGQPRWKSLEPRRLEELRARIGGTLREFGYPC